MTDVEDSDLTRTKLDRPGPPPSARQAPVPGPPAEPPALRLPPRSYDLRPGDKINDYEIIRELGRGGMGVVYRARDITLGRLVAVKVLLNVSGHSVERFLAEARATARCKHENIVVIHQVDKHHGLPYIVLEHVEGQTLHQWMKERTITPSDAQEGEPPMLPVPPSVAVELMVPVVRALDCAHKLKIVHRDLKPANIMLERRHDATTLDALGRLIKVLDFGIAKDLNVDGPPTDAIKGTFRYMSPEQWSKRDIGATSDLWAVGIILYELVIGAHPLAPASMADLARVTRLDEPMPSAAKARPDLGPLGAIIDRCLRKRCEERIDSAEELLHELEPFLPPKRLVEGRSPFTGLHAFQEADADRFFGRDRDIGSAIDRLRQQAMLAIVGISGAGKSSFVRAGLIPALKHLGEGWEAVVVRPGRAPLATLAEHCAKVAPDIANASMASLQEAPGQLGAALRARCREKGLRVLVFVDQFEELYTLGAIETEREAFLRGLEGIADDPSSPLRVVFTIRADLLHRAAPLARGMPFLVPMGSAGLRAALTQPVKAAGYRFESEEMVDAMLGALERTRGPLPLLQFTAVKLWEARDRGKKLLTRQSYEELGGVAGALSTHADAVVAALSPEEQPICRAVFLRLVTPERTRAMVNMSELRDLVQDGAAVEQVIQRLVDAWILLLDNATVELVHESLIESWPKLKEWLEESSRDAQFPKRLRAAAQHWDEGGEAEDMLWRDRAAQDAAAFLERWRSDPKAVGLIEREVRYLEAVVRRSQRARRRQQWIAAGIFVMLVVVVLIMALLAVRASREAKHAHDESTRVIRAHQAVVDTAELAAGHAAEAVALQFDRYRAAVEAAGRDPRVVRAAVSGSPSETVKVCADLFNKLDGPTAGPFAHWLLFDAGGTLLGRFPIGVVSTVGRSYTFRDYYRGAKEHAEKGDRSAYVARTHRSEGDKEYGIAIAFPLQDDAGHWVGILTAQLPTGSALGSIKFPPVGSDGLTVALLSPRDRDREGTPDPEPVIIMHGRLGRGQTAPVDAADVLGSHSFVRRVPVRGTPLFVLVSVAYEGPLGGAAP